VSSGRYLQNLRIEAVQFSETSINIYHTTRHHIPEDISSAKEYISPFTLSRRPSSGGTTILSDAVSCANINSGVAAPSRELSPFDVPIF
jgi:hypothetical protein